MKWRLSSFLVLFFLFFGLSSPSFASNTFVIDSLKERYAFNEFLEFLPDSKRELNEVLIQGTLLNHRFQPFKIGEQKYASLQQGVPYWFRIRIHKKIDVILENWLLSFGDVDSVEVFFPNGLSKVTGTLYSQSQKEKFPLGVMGDRIYWTLDSTEPFSLYFRVKGGWNGAPKLDVKLQNKDFYQTANYVFQTRRDWLFFGFTLTIIIFNLIFFIGTGDFAFLYHLLFVLAVTLFLMSAMQILSDFTLLKYVPNLIQYFDYFILAILDISYLMFVKINLSVNAKLIKYDKVLQRMIYARFPAFLLFIIVFAFSQNEQLSDGVSATYISIQYIIVLVILFRLSRLKLLEVIFLLGGTLLMFSGVILNSIFIVEGSGLRRSFTEFGVVGEILVFSILLGYRLRNLNRLKNEAAKQKEVNDFKTKLYDNITHEFRTSLTLIIGESDQIIKSNHKQMHDQAKRIAYAGNTILRLVNQLLELGKAEAGRLKLENKRSDIARFIKYLVNSFESFAQSKEVHLELLTELKNLEMDFDTNKMQQVISNLLSNALKFTPAGGEVNVFMKVQQQKFKEYLQIEVEDNGRGIAEEQLPYVFDRFYQADNSSKDFGAGSGIGLALTKELIKLMGGEISVKSQIGKGSIFTIKIPITKVSEKEDFLLTQTPQIEVEQKELISQLKLMPFNVNRTVSENEKPSLLIIEDSVQIIDYIKELIGTDFNLLITYNGQQGIKKALEYIPDIIISDVIMPEKNGFEVCEILRQDERTSHIPIILLTAKVDIEDKLKGLQKGADAYLAKPFVKEELLIRINNLLVIRQKSQAYYRNLDDLKEDQMEDEFLLKAKKIILENLGDENFRTDQFCHTLSLSKAQVYRKIKALTGRPTAGFITFVRLSEAKKILVRQKDLTIAEIAYRVGFYDPNFFSRSFKKEYGHTPSEMRSKRLTKPGKDS